MLEQQMSERGGGGELSEPRTQRASSRDMEGENEEIKVGPIWVFAMMNLFLPWDISIFAVVLRVWQRAYILIRHHGGAY